MRLHLHLLAVPVALGACFNVTDPPSPPPPVDPPVVACTPPTAVVRCGDPFAALDASDDASADASADAAGDAGCDAGTTKYDPCQLPPSVCADSHWAAYFDDGTCGADGKCELVTKYHYCETGCAAGACISRGFTAPSRGF